MRNPAARKPPDDGREGRAPLTRAARSTGARRRFRPLPVLHVVSETLPPAAWILSVVSSNPLEIRALASLMNFAIYLLF